MNKYLRIGLRFRLLAIMFCFLMTGWSFSTTAQQISPNLSTLGQSVSQAGNSMRFKRYYVEDGLAANTVHTILQDSNGFMWFGTSVGLNRYDGYRFTILKNDPDNPKSISNNAIRALIEDRKEKALWIGTQRGGLNRYDLSDETVTRFSHDPNNANSLSGDDILTLFQDKKGRIWAGMERNGLTRFDPKTMTFERFVHDPKDPESIGPGLIWKVLVDETETVWVCNVKTGLYRLTPDAKNFERYVPVKDLNSPRSIYRNDNSTLWVGTRNGSIVILDEKTARVIDILEPNPLKGRPIDAIVKDPYGSIWIGTVGNGMYQYNSETKTFTQYQYQLGNPTSLSGNRIRTILITKEGVVWIGMRDGGMSSFSLSQLKFALFQNNASDPHSLSANTVYSVLKDRHGSLWVGNGGGIINRMEPTSGKFYRYQLETITKDTAYTQCIYEDLEGNLWVGGWNLGVQRYQPDIDRFEVVHKHIPGNPDSLSSNNSYALFREKSGTFWVGTLYGALSRYDPKEKRFYHYTKNIDNPNSYSDNETTCIYKDRKGTLWMGTFSGGLNRYNRKKDQFDVFQNDSNNPNSIVKGSIFSLYEDHSGYLWITTSNGLNRFDYQSETFTSFTQKDGLPSDMVNSTLEDKKGNLWISSSRGLSRFNPKTGEFRNYDVTYGLQGNEFRGRAASYMSKEGRMYFGGINGLSAFFPEQITLNSFLPSAQITELRIYNQPIYVGGSLLKKSFWDLDQLTFSPKDDIISFEFSALSYTSPLRNRYQYILEGFEKKWNEVDSTRRFATYTNLNPGNYTFKIKASNNDGIWNQSETSLSVVVLPAWYQTLYFRLTFLISIAMILIIGFKWRVYAVEKRNRMLEAQITERTKELVTAKEQAETAKEQAETANKAKSTFLASMSHELRTPLNSILGFSEILRQEALSRKLELDSKQMKNLALIHKGGELLLTLINNVLDLSKIEAGKSTLNPTSFDLYNMLYDLEEMFSQRAKQKNLTLLFSHDSGTPQFIQADQMKLRQILINLLGNAFKFTNQGEISVHTKKVKEDLDEMGQSSGNSQTLLFEVQDSGYGIASDEIDSLFKAFSQTSTGVSKQKGTGLGLAISKELVHLMGGSLNVKSQLVEGSLFYFTIQVEKAEKEAVVTKTTRKKVIGLKPGQRRFKVLVVDDTTSNRDLLNQILESIGFEIKEAENGKVALEVWERWLPDIILMDIRMPVMDGLKATKRIKKTRNGKNTVILALSASVFEDERKRVLESGCNDFLRKPFKEFELFEMMGAHLNIEYEYMELDEAHGKYPEEKRSITIDQIKKIPEDILKELKEASIKGDTQTIDVAIDEIQGHDEKVAKKFKELADVFEYSEITALIEKSEV